MRELSSRPSAVSTPSRMMYAPPLPNGRMASVGPSVHRADVTPIAALESNPGNRYGAIPS